MGLHMFFQVPVWASPSRNKRTSDAVFMFQMWSVAVFPLAGRGGEERELAAVPPLFLQDAVPSLGCNRAHHADNELPPRSSAARTANPDATMAICSTFSWKAFTGASRRNHLLHAGKWFIPAGVRGLTMEARPWWRGLRIRSRFFHFFQGPLCKSVGHCCYFLFTLRGLHVKCTHRLMNE
jgi:hypothetical protein